MTYKSGKKINDLNEVAHNLELEWNQPTMISAFLFKVQQHKEGDNHVYSYNAANEYQELLIDADPRRVTDSKKDGMIVLSRLWQKGSRRRHDW